MKTEDRVESGSIPVYGSNGIVGYHDTPLVPCSGIIVGRKGSIGAIHMSKGPFWPIDTTYYIEPHPSIDLSYLYYLLKTLNLNYLDKSSSIPGLNRNDVYSKKIPIPPLSTQRKIVAILEWAEHLRRLRVEADALTERLVQSEFLEMFGDPVTNPMGWDQKLLYELTDENHGISCGPFGTQLKVADLLNDGVLVLGIENIGVNEFIQTNPKCIEHERLSEFSSFIVRSQDIILSRAGTVGRCCIVPESINIAILGSNLLKIRLNPQKMVPEFLTSAFSYAESLQKQIQLNSPGGSYSFLSTSKLGSIKIIVPPLALQKQYLWKISQIENMSGHQKCALLEINTLFDALMSKAFTGDLIA